MIGRLPLETVTLFYKFGSFVRRNKVGVTVFGLCCMASMVALAYTTVDHATRVRGLWVLSGKVYPDAAGNTTCQYTRNPDGYIGHTMGDPLYEKFVAIYTSPVTSLWQSRTDIGHQGNYDCGTIGTTTANITDHNCITGETDCVTFVLEGDMTHGTTGG